VNEAVEYEYLLPHQFEARMEACPLAYIPVGSLEWHGEHMALGNDAIKIHGLCCAAARLGGGVVFPPIYYGIPFMVGFGSRYRFKANLPVTDDFLRNLLTTTLTALDDVGFRAAILITGHTCEQQSQLMRDVAAQFQGNMAVYGTDDMEWADDIDFTSDHAAKWETSILWYLRPELVDVYRLPRDTSVRLEGVFGDDPRVHASRELGRAAVAAIARDLATLGAQLLSRKSPGGNSDESGARP
jgi:creatinine amidohydrolase